MFHISGSRDIKEGKIVKPLPSPQKIREYVLEQLRGEKNCL